MINESACLTLIAPRQLREELFDYLSEQTDLVTGFTASDAAGHGAEVRLHTAAERVKGHADQVVVRVILQKIDADLMLDRLRVRLDKEKGPPASLQTPTYHSAMIPGTSGQCRTPHCIRMTPSGPPRQFSIEFAKDAGERQRMQTWPSAG